MSTAYLYCPNHGRRLRVGFSQTTSPGAFELDPGALRPRQPNGYSIPSGKLQKPCDLGHCKSKTEAKTAASWNGTQASSFCTYPIGAESGSGIPLH